MEIYIYIVYITSFVMRSLDIGSIDRVAAIRNIYILIVVNALLKQDIGFPEIKLFVIMQFGLVKQLPTRQLAKDIDRPVRERELAFQGEVREDVILGVVVAQIAVAVIATSVDVAATFVCRIGASVILKNVCVRMMVHE